MENIDSGCVRASMLRFPSGNKFPCAQWLTLPYKPNSFGPSYVTHKALVVKLLIIN